MRDNPLHIAALGADAEVRGNRLIRMFSVALPLILSKGVLLGGFQDDTLVGIVSYVDLLREMPIESERRDRTAPAHARKN